MHGRYAAAVPIAMWNACWEYHKSSRIGLISLTMDLQAHGAAEDVEQLIDHMPVEARRRTFTWRGLDAVNAAAGRPRIATDQRLCDPFACCSEAVEVHFSQEFHRMLPCLKLAAEAEVIRCVLHVRLQDAEGDHGVA